MTPHDGVVTPGVRAAACGVAIENYGAILPGVPGCRDGRVNP